jgi:uncharacterized protein
MISGSPTGVRCSAARVQTQPAGGRGALDLGGDQLLTAADGASLITAEDYAVALVDELEKNNAVRRRISVAC